MAQFATTSGERKISSLARKLYDVPDDETLQRVEKALENANPALAEIGKLPHGTPVEVPDVRGVEFTPASGTLSDLAGTSALHSLHGSLPDLKETLRTTLNEQVSARRADVRSLDTAAAKRVSRDDQGVSSRLKEARVQADVTLQQAMAIRDDQPKALDELRGDLEDLLNLFG